MDSPAKKLLKTQYFNVDLHRKFRSLAKFNQELDGLTPREPGVEILHVNQAEEQGTHRDKYEFTQQVHANLLVRDQADIVSVVTTGRYTSDGAQQITVINKPDRPQLIIASNPNPKDREATTLGEEDGSLRVEATLNPPGLDISRGVVYAVLDVARQRDGHIPFKMHVGWHGALLRDCHKDGHDQTTYKAAVKAFRDYVNLVSNGKMVARLDMGREKKQANFHKVITAQAKQFTVGTFDRADMPEHLQQLLPNDDQATFGKEFQLSFGVLSETEADELSKSPLYDIEGRRRFHKMLRRVVSDADAELRALKTLMAQIKRHKWVISTGTKKIEGEVHLNQVEDALKRAGDTVYILQRFLGLFGERTSHGQPSLLDYHLEWLSTVSGASSRFKETSITPLEDITMFAQAPSAAPAAGALEITGVTEPKEGEEGEDTDMPDADQTDEFDFLAERVVDTRSAKKGGWPAAALKWLQLICLHEVGLLRATEFGDFENKSATEKVESEHILMADIAVIDIHRSKWEQDDRASFNEMLLDFATRFPNLHLDITEMTEKFTEGAEKKAKDFFAKKRSTEDSIRLKQKKPAMTEIESSERLASHKSAVDTAKQEHMESLVFSGTYHCEAIIMGALVILSQPGVAEDLTDEWLACNGIFALKTELLAMLRNPLPLLCVSKRCCPGCWTVFKKIANDNIFPKDQARVAMPGYHTKWYSHALPPFLPVDYVEVAVLEAEQQALGKLKRLQLVIAQEKLLKSAVAKSSSEGAPSNPPSSAAPSPVKKRKVLEAPKIVRDEDEVEE